MSQYRGLRKQNSGKWQVQMSIDGKQQTFGTFEIELEAAQAFDAKCRAVWKSNLQPDFNVRVCDHFDTTSSALLRELDESNRFVQKSAKSTSI